LLAIPKKLSGCSYLKHLPVHELKVDRSFVSQMLQSSSDAVIVHSTIDLGRNLGLRVVAEGVENALPSGSSTWWAAMPSRAITSADPSPLTTSPAGSNDKPPPRQDPISESQGPTRIPRQV
jgi:hypothetical protein